MATESGAYPPCAKPQAEAWREGHGDALRFGWWCLTCDIEVAGLPVEQATRAAAVHNGDRAKGDSESSS